MSTEEAKGALGARVRRRREAFGLTIDQAAVRGEMSAVTWTRVEHGKKVRGLTYSGVDRVLMWKPGSCAEFLLRGAEPVPIGPLSADEAADAITEERMDAALREAGVAGLTFEQAMARAEEISKEIREFLDGRGITLSARQTRVVETWAKRLEEDLRAAEADDEPHAS